MQISAINKYQQPQFKSTIPVYHWTRELGGSFSPVDDKIVTKVLQEKLVKYNYNLAMAMQAYNFGDGSFKKVLNAYSNETGRAIEDIINDKKDLGWIKYVEMFHLNPNNFGV